MKLLKLLPLVRLAASDMKKTGIEEPFISVTTGSGPINDVLLAPTARPLSVRKAKYPVKAELEHVNKKTIKVIDLVRHLQLHPVMPNCDPSMAAIRAKIEGRPAWAVIFALHWRLRSPDLFAWFKDHEKQILEATSRRQVIELFVDTYNVPTLIWSSQLTAELKTAEMARTKSIRFSNRLLATDVPSVAELLRNCLYKFALMIPAKLEPDRAIGTATQT
jgi:hypothetical protein